MPITSPIICRDASTYLPIVTLTPASESSLTTSTPVTVSGVNYIDRAYSAAYAQYTATQAVPSFGVPWVVTSDTPAVCTVAGNTVTRIADGIGKIRFTGPGGFSKVAQVNFNSSNLAAKRVWTGVVPGGLSALYSDSLLARVSPTKQLNYYASGVGSSSGVMVPNPNCWLAGVDVSSSAVATSFGGDFGTANSGVLLTRRHWFGMKHWGIQVENMGPGSILTFAGADGVKHSRTVVARYIHPTLDLVCSLLNADVPAGINPLPLAPLNHREGTSSRLYGLGFQMTQEKNVPIAGFDDFWDKAGIFGAPAAWDPDFTLKTDPAHRLYGLGNLMQRGRGGDSGGMICGLIGNQPFLVAQFTSAASGIYSPIIKTDMNAMIASVDAAAGISTGYTVGVLEIVSAFDPLSLSPAMWLDASDSATLYDAVTGGALVTGSGAVARWQDKSGNARHATQAILGARPLRQAAILNGRAVLRFDGVDDAMGHGLSVVGDNTVFMVARSYEDRTDSRVMFQATLPNNPLNCTIRQENPVGQWGTYRGSGPIFSGQTLKGAYKIVSVHAVGTNGSMTTNGSLVNFTSGGFYQDGANRQHVGGFGATEQIKCDIAEILVFPTALSPADRAAVETYLNAKWACY